MKYQDFAPTQFDPKGLGLDDRQNWRVAGVSRTRDTGPLDESNFECTLKALGGESRCVEVHRFGHWGPGWFEIILVSPTAKKKNEILDEIEAALANYPIVDEMDWSERDFEAACESWDTTDMRDRISILAKHNCSIFAARRDEIPQGLPYYDDFHESV